jgi:arginyl-tRNA synthetase
MRKILDNQLRDVLQQLLAGRAETIGEIPFSIERARNPKHGDFASNIALVLGKRIGENPRVLAGQIAAAFPASQILENVEVAGPGFINFKLSRRAFEAVVTTIVEEGANYGRSELGAGSSIHLEFVSANPTGPLHIGHGRGAAYGAVVANLLQTVGFSVHREYYVNDAGRQMDILALSVWLRLLQAAGLDICFPQPAYQGNYVAGIAAALLREDADLVPAAAPDWPAESEGPERLLDDYIALAKQLLGVRFQRVLDFGLQWILAEIKDDLKHFGVEYENWFSERSLTPDAVNHALQRLTEAGASYRHGGALWFRSSAHGDEKDRVLVRENGQPTYFAADVAYHVNKLEAGYGQLIDIWGADHHGYIPRVKAVLRALQYDPERLEVRLVQFATLYRGAEKVQMSTRSGEFVTLRQLCDEVGTDAARFFYVIRKSEQHLDFDLELAKSRSKDNPVYYIQYAHARICSVFKQLAEQGMEWQREIGVASLAELAKPHEHSLLRQLSRYPEVIEAAALSREPHQLAFYLQDLANDFHGYYDSEKFIVESASLRNARLSLVAACRQVIANGLQILGVSAPESM